MVFFNREKFVSWCHNSIFYFLYGLVIVLCLSLDTETWVVSTVKWSCYKKLLKTVLGALAALYLLFTRILRHKFVLTVSTSKQKNWYFKLGLSDVKIYEFWLVALEVSWITKLLWKIWLKTLNLLHRKTPMHMYFVFHSKAFTDFLIKVPTDFFTSNWEPYCLMMGSGVATKSQVTSVLLDLVSSSERWRQFMQVFPKL